MKRSFALIAAALLASCRSTPEPVNPVSESERVRIARHGLAAEFTPAIDRLTYFGRETGRNLLHVTDLKRDVPSDGSYTFWGGCYTWTAPQKALPGTTLGWLNADRTAPLDWPPDPAMDVGPARRAGQSLDSFSFTGPDQRTGLREEKAFRLIGPDLAEHEFTLHNRSAVPVTAAPWTSTAAARADVIAIRLTGTTRLHGWDAASVERLRSIMSEPDARGWAIINLAKARWDGGIKVYFSPASGASDSPPRDVEIAIWSRNAKAWLHRSLGEMPAADVARLEAAGEGPVAVYIQPNKGRDPIIEAELYGPLSEVAPDGRATSVETWRVIPSLKPSTAVLP